MTFAFIKIIHISSIVLSYLLFTLRGIWMMQDASNLQQRWVKILPHIIDTALLVSAIALAMAIQQSPLHDTWLTAKVVGLLIYIGLGMVAMRFGKTRQTKIVAWVAAETVFFYIVLVALTKSPVLNLF